MESLRSKTVCNIMKFRPLGPWIIETPSPIYRQERSKHSDLIHKHEQFRNGPSDPILPLTTRAAKQMATHK
jgi:hypothetical protein